MILRIKPGILKLPHLEKNPFGWFRGGNKNIMFHHAAIMRWYLKLIDTLPNETTLFGDRVWSLKPVVQDLPGISNWHKSNISTKIQAPLEDSMPTINKLKSSKLALHSSMYADSHINKYKIHIHNIYIYIYVYIIMSTSKNMCIYIYIYM